MLNAATKTSPSIPQGKFLVGNTNINNGQDPPEVVFVAELFRSRAGRRKAWVRPP